MTSLAARVKHAKRCYARRPDLYADLRTSFAVGARLRDMHSGREWIVDSRDLHGIGLTSPDGEQGMAYAHGDALLRFAIPTARSGQQP